MKTHSHLSSLRFFPRELLAPGGVWLKKGDSIYRKKYAKTLRDIGASGNADYFYEGQFMQQMVKELQEAGAIIEGEDFLNYTAIQRDPVESEFDGLRVFGSPPPSSGAVLALILNILKGYSHVTKMDTVYNEYIHTLLLGYDFHGSDFGSLAYHRIVESFKFAFGQRLLLGDPAFNDTVNEVLYMCIRNHMAIMQNNCGHRCIHHTVGELKMQ